jgi:Flp pilus assembly protein TadB
MGDSGAGGRPDMGESIEQRRRGGMSTLDKALVGAGVVGGVLVILWVVHAVLGLLLWVFKVAILVVVVMLVVRLVHLFTRGSRSRS